MSVWQNLCNISVQNIKCISFLFYFTSILLRSKRDIHAVRLTISYSKTVYKAGLTVSYFFCPSSDIRLVTNTRSTYKTGLMRFRGMLVLYINYLYRSTYFRSLILSPLTLQDTVKVRLIDMCEGHTISVKYSWASSNGKPNRSNVFSACY